MDLFSDQFIGHFTELTLQTIGSDLVHLRSQGARGQAASPYIYERLLDRWGRILASEKERGEPVEAMHAIAASCRMMAWLHGEKGRRDIAPLLQILFPDESCVVDMTRVQGSDCYVLIGQNDKIAHLFQGARAEGPSRPNPAKQTQQGRVLTFRPRSPKDPA